MSKKLYITTAIPYVNAKPHVGNALDYLIADIWARYHRHNGQDVRFQVGTDEHGNKIAAKAKEAGQEPQVYVDSVYGNFENLMKALGASYTDFIRTTDEHHKASVQYIWQKLQPYIYKGTYTGWYCIGCERFVTDKEAQENDGSCPDHSKPYEHLSEENYYFKLSAFTEKIKEAIDSHKFEIVPAFRKNEILKLLEGGLEDISISRPKKNLSWGVAIPGDDTQVMYVWVDALSNYITVLGYPDNEQWREYWPADVQVVGKDIMRFHAAIWPAMLLALDLPLPKKLLAHGFIDVGGTKMSKSLGNVVDPIQIIEQYGVDAFRYYFSRHVSTQDDGDFTFEKFENAYNNELSNELGNLVQRVVAMINRYQSGVMGDGSLPNHDTTAYHEKMRSLEFNKAMDEAWLMVRSLNQYLEEVKPWTVAKEKDTNPDAEAHLEEILLHAVGTLQQIADLLLPFLPTTAEAMQKIFAGGVITPYDGVLFPKRYIHTPDPHAPKQ
jgi:methionyl-tRNA synthetase